MYSVSLQSFSYKLRKPFKISREVQTSADVLVCEISDGSYTGRGEAAGVPYKGETVDSIKAEIEGVNNRISEGISRSELQKLMPPGGARNAVDCALWDLEAKRTGKTIWELLDRPAKPVVTVYTVGIAEPDAMQQDAREHSGYPILKVKVGIGDPIRQIESIVKGAPNSSIVIDANQAWTIADLERYAERLKTLGVVMIEQPLAADADQGLQDYDSPLPLCADESCATTADLQRLQGLYSMVNIKLDKTGGLTEALNLADKAESMGFELMVGNMLGSSLAMAPAFVIAQRCRFVDIDGPLLQADDCAHPLHYDNGKVGVFTPDLWG